MSAGARRLRVSVACVLGAGVAFAAGALAVSGARAAASVTVGAGLACGNLWLLGHLVRRAAPRLWLGAALLSMLVELVLAGAALGLRLAAPAPFVLGCAALPAGLALGSVLSDRLLPPEE